MGGNGNDNRLNFNSLWANSLHSDYQLILESNVIDECQERRLLIGGFHQIVWYQKSRDFVTGLLSRVHLHKKIVIGRAYGLLQCSFCVCLARDNNIYFREEGYCCLKYLLQ